MGNRMAAEVLFSALSRLEYRGYDSCGIAVKENGLSIFKDVLRVDVLRSRSPKFQGKVGIGHTRWATHGKPSQVNAHPHCDCSGNIAVVHNGIISNYQALREKLSKEGHRFSSETDTEVIPHLLEKYYRGNLEEALEAALLEIEGSYALIALCSVEDKLVMARKDSPLIVGLSDRETFIASDVPAILNYTDRVLYLEDGDIGVVTESGLSLKRKGVSAKGEEHKITWSAEQAQKGGFEHFMLKEIHEQPRVIRDSVTSSLAQPVMVYKTLTKAQRASGLAIFACGTSYHAGLVGKYLIEELLGVPVRVELASEYNYQPLSWVPPLSFAITQSGETADTLKAMKRLRAAGSQVIAITNVVGSTASRLANQTMYTRAGPEISVAATKSFVAQLVVLYLLALPYSRLSSRVNDRLNQELRQLPGKVQQVLAHQEPIVEAADFLSRHHSVFFIGRGLNYPVALEGALKLKEISYIHAEGYAAGELKHGPFAMLDEKTPVVALLTHDSTYGAMLTSIKEVRARCAPVIAVVPDDDPAVAGLADMVISRPNTEALF
jgi:glucosamine--fructose-6-phosphate aminotransferase (isomerizing)